MQNFINTDLIVIGGGPAGLAAALEAHKQGVKDIIIIERERELGGILPQCIHTGFGLHIFNEELTGPEYAERFIKSVKKAGIRIYLNTIVLNIGSNKSNQNAAVSSINKTVVAVNGENGIMKFSSKAVILAMGCRERARGALNIPGTRPAGIYTAGTAQRFVNIEGFMPGKKVVILGSGDIGLIMARRMTLEGAEVRLVCEIMPYSGGLTRNIVQCLEDFNIPLRFNCTVTEIHGRERLEGVTISEVDENRKPITGTSQYIECDTLLLSVGLIPENELSQGAEIKLDPITLGPVVNESMETSITGIFACGNVLHVHDLVDYVSEESQLAGRSAARYISTRSTCIKASGTGSIVSYVNDIPHASIPETINVKAGKGIRYVIPHIIRSSILEEESKLLFRADNVYKNKKLTITFRNNVIYTKNMPRANPGEMESIKLRILSKFLSSSDNIEDIEDILSEDLIISIEDR